MGNPRVLTIQRATETKRMRAKYMKERELLQRWAGPEGDERRPATCVLRPFYISMMVLVTERRLDWTHNIFPHAGEKPRLPVVAMATSIDQVRCQVVSTTGAVAVRRELADRDFGFQNTGSFFPWPGCSCR